MSHQMDKMRKALEAAERHIVETSSVGSSAHQQVLNQIGQALEPVRRAFTISRSEDELYLFASIVSRVARPLNLVELDAIVFGGDHRLNRFKAGSVEVIISDGGASQHLIAPNIDVLYRKHHGNESLVFHKGDADDLNELHQRVIVPQ